jgi:hypothetical protein
MSSHREAPQIAKDPVADSTDVYAFKSPDKPDTITLIANYIPLQLPDGGPNFYEFGDDVTYDINIDNTGSGTPNITYRFNFTTVNTIPTTFLYNDGPILSLTDAHWNRRQTYMLTRLDYVDGTAAPTSTTTFGPFPCPPCNIGPLSTPNYSTLGAMAIKSFSNGGFTGTVFAGQRAEGFYVDLGAIFDLATLRPFQADHATFGLSHTGLGKMAQAVNSTAELNVHSLALQIPITQLKGTANAVIGVWTAASRPASRTYEGTANFGEYVTAGGLEQVSRLGNPLVNEVLIPLAQKDLWNANPPTGDSGFTEYFSNPELARLLPGLYPGVFKRLNEYNTINGSFTTNTSGPDRADISAIFLTGLPGGLIKGFSNHNALPGVTADMLRLNTSIPAAKHPNVFGLLGGDLAGFPNGRRVWDDVTTIELRALAGATLPLVDAAYAAKKPDAASGLVQQGLSNAKGTMSTAFGERYQKVFPYLGPPYGGAYIAEAGPLVHG